MVKQLSELGEQLPCECIAVSSEHFLTSEDMLTKWFSSEKLPVMETFYRNMRRHYGILMEGSKPVSGKWNYDHDNREALKKDVPLPEPLVFANDVTGIVERLRRHGIKSLGEITEQSGKYHLLWPVNRKQSQALLEHFLRYCLPQFGRYQDAMITSDKPQSWSLFHSRIAFSLNSKMLHPLDVINQALSHWQANPDAISLAQIEGFIRQILGWREYMRAIYLVRMPEYAGLNFFNHQRALPDFFWHGETNMSCVRHAIRQSLEYGYAHHIQRLMVTGNFALLSGCSPDDVDQWYLGIYVDAIEWAQITNTRGMSQFADGGMVATKPYVSSGQYINKMSNYCSSCQYDVKKKTGEHACPFNSLYWHFLDRHQKVLTRNPRIGMMYRHWDNLEEAQRQAVLDQAETYLANINRL